MSFIEFIKEFFRHTTTIKGQLYGPAHIVVAILATLSWIGLGVYFGLKNKDKDENTKLKPLKIVGVGIVVVDVLNFINLFCTVEAIKIAKTQLPFFLCDILVFALPIAAFIKNKKLQNASLEYILCLGILAGVMGTWVNGGLFNNHPVWSIRVIFNLCLHCFPAFAAMYIICSKSASLEFKRIGYTYLFIAPFLVISLILDFTPLKANYMFLNDPDGTPFQLFFNMVGGKQPWYAITVIVGMAAYIAIFYAGWTLVVYIIKKVNSKNHPTNSDIKGTSN